jgi:Mycothiol maleylpyruvate isomerase N-terminal domain
VVDAAGTSPITAADVDLAVVLAADALNAALDQDWRVPAGDLEWDCRETVEHMADDLFAYAGQLGPRRPPQDTYVPFAWQRRPGGPALTIFTEAATDNAGLVQVFEACGAFLSSLVTTVSPGTRAWHSMGVGDPAGFAAMGVVEVLVHMRDVAAGLGFGWTPPEDLCDRVLYRLFPDAPADTPRWETLLWATGRGSLAGRERLADWQWHSAPPEH